MKKIVAACAIAAAVIVLVVPFHPEAVVLQLLNSATPSSTMQHRINWVVVESGGNFAMFALLGVALWIFVKRPVRAMVLGLALSAAAELAQAFIPNRVPSVTDLITNAIGAAAGALAAQVIANRRSDRPSNTAEVSPG